MARRPSSPDLPPEDVAERIVDIDVAAEMESSFLEYAYSVIYTRALPDARDGLKPVQRRILFQMSEMGLRPDRPYVKSARVVGDVMGKLHPHGDTAIYDAMVRLAQPFSLRLPLIDGHGNFGSLDDGPAAPRYTEARMAPAATAMTQGLDEDTVEFVPNYDNKTMQPAVLPSAIPNLLVNGAAGIAVGMATNMAPHNLVEVVAAARHLVAHPDATLEDLLRFVPGPDLPTGGKVVGLEGVREAYRTGRGAFRTRATARIENVTPRRQGIVITELPYLVGPEKILEKIKEGVQAKRLVGISGADDFTDRTHGVRLVVEVKSGFHPEAVLEQLYRATPLEDSFNINNVVLVDGQPRTLGLRELLQVWVDHRIDVVRRRSRHRLTQRLDRQHLVEGLLLAILDIDEVIQLIRAAEDADAARTRLQQVFDLSEKQAEYILELRLRRLTRFSRVELESERDRLAAEIAELQEILGDEARLRALVSDEMAEVAQTYGTPRRTVLLESAGASAVGALPVPATATGGRASARAAAPLEIADTPCFALLSATGLLARTADDHRPTRPEGARARHDVLTSVVATTARAQVGAVTSHGRVVRVGVLDLPALAPSHGAPSLSGGVPLDEVIALDKGERVVGLCSLAPDAPTLALGTAGGVVKRVTTAEAPANRDAWEVVGLKDGDVVVGCAEVTDEDELVLVSSDASLLRFRASAVRPQGRPAGGMAGIALGAGARVLSFGAIGPGVEAQVVTVAGSSVALPGTQAGTAKVTPFDVYPAKGRATGGVRSHRFLKGEDTLLLAWVGPAPACATGSAGQAVDLPTPDPRRDGSGTPLAAPVHAVG
ncbi:DNA gyrase/topoisomerase IV subunit A [Cellulomonas endophytica]|uniref:DNA gyrase/topoisomerase IV subunit A n=1 Tax=Cellulomonas endophytica TaxID=2494735 RepID=UPI001012B7DC|nr:DNA topoisomerase IV subunit A [Cellulomonas endophytica]